MKNLILLCTIVFLSFWKLPATLADDSDIFGSSVDPNVMLLIDSSGSMNNTVPSIPYDLNTTYNTPLTYNTTKVYQKFTRVPDCVPNPRPCYRVYADSVSDVNDSSARTALDTTGFWNGPISGSNVSLFYGNYLNYLACSSCTASEPKNVIAKRVLTNLVNNVQGVRFGAMKFAAGGGAMMEPIRDMTSANKTTLVNTINNMTTTSVGTPTGPQIKHGGQYYGGGFGGNASPIQLACQPNFVIVLSDGLYTGSDPWSEAETLYTTDHYGTSADGIQNVIVHTIGFDIDGTSQEEIDARDALRRTAQEGGGTFITAANSAELEIALQDAIGQIVAATFSFATPVVPTTSTSGNSRAYIASFRSNPSRSFWNGFLKAYDRDSNGLIPVDGNNIPLISALAWDAGNVLSQKAAASRTIYTFLGGSRVDFTRTNISSTDLGVADNATRDKVVDFIRGLDSYDEDSDPSTTERAWKLGDIFHSSPVLVTPPPLSSLDPTYVTFKSNKAGRASVLILGTNGGMIHAFKESDGDELWGFIPPDLLESGVVL